ncbi:hypothetical protein SDC9_87523 [bioreactor metagenome]|uniref:Uncharacterized protein n=1 Tax=bioreactor metagenome TaxID=1076179 RepID=A0A644ZJ14_9ZZZZ
MGFIGKELDHITAVPHGNVPFFNFSMEYTHHFFGGIRPEADAPVARVMVGLVPGIPAVAVAGKVHPKADEIVKSPERILGFNESDVTMNRAASGVRLDHGVRRVGNGTGVTESIVGLLVAAGVAAGAAFAVVRNDEQVVHAHALEMYRTRQRGRPRSNYQGIGAKDREAEPLNRPLCM